MCAITLGYLSEKTSFDETVLNNIIRNSVSTQKKISNKTTNSTFSRMGGTV